MDRLCVSSIRDDTSLICWSEKHGCFQTSAIKDDGRFRDGPLIITDDNGMRLIRECWIAFASVLSRMIVFGRRIALVSGLSRMIAVYLLVQKCWIALEPVLLLSRHLPKECIRFLPDIHILWLIGRDRKGVAHDTASLLHTLNLT